MIETNSDTAKSPLRLHIGGTEVREGWKILNIQPGPHVDYVGNCVDLGRFANNSIEEIYVSHVFEHLGVRDKLPKAMSEANRVLKPGGIIRVGVPDMDVLCRLFTNPEATVQDQFEIMLMIYGGQIDPYDFHHFGLNFKLMEYCLKRCKFRDVRRVDFFGLFEDQTTAVFRGVPISLNVQAVK